MKVEKMLSLSRETSEAVTGLKTLTGSTDEELANALDVPVHALKKVEQGRADAGTTERTAQKLASMIRASKGQKLGATKQRPEERKSIKESATDGRGRDFYGIRREKKNPYSSLGEDQGEKVDGRAERDAFGKRKSKRHQGAF